MTTDSVDVLQGRFPSVDRRFVRDRKGHPVDQSIAVENNELTETEIYDLVEGAGVDRQYKELTGETRKLVNQALGSLWKINRIGLDVEEKDMSRVGGINEMHKAVEENSESTRYQFHGEIHNWFVDSAREVVLLPLAKTEGEANTHRGVSTIKPDEYIKRLVRVGQDYDHISSNIYNFDQRSGVKDYLENERKGDLKQMERILLDEIHNIVPKIPTSIASE